MAGRAYGVAVDGLPCPLPSLDGLPCLLRCGAHAHATNLSPTHRPGHRQQRVHPVGAQFVFAAAAHRPRGGRAAWVTSLSFWLSHDHSMSVVRGRAQLVHDL